MRPCKSCRRPIHLLHVEGGKWIPVDADPTPSGNILVDLAGRSAQVLNGDEAALARIEGRQLYIPHFATCPHASSHRRSP